MSVSKTITTLVSWKTVIICSLLIIGLFKGQSVFAPEESYSFPFFLCLIVLIFCVSISCVHYTFSEKYLIMRFLGIPIRFMKWSEVSYAIYVHTWKEAGNIRARYTPSVMHGNAIIVSLKYCPPFNPEFDSRSDFAVTHALNSVFIGLPTKNKDLFISVFQEFYPDLEIQPRGSQG